MNDYIVRATAAEETVRAFAIKSTELTAEAREIHHTFPVVTAALGRLLSAGAMMGSMMKGEDDKLTLQMKGDGPIAQMTVTADSHGNVKGFAANPSVDIPLKRAGNAATAGLITARCNDAGQSCDKEAEHQGQQAVHLISGAFELLPDEDAPDGGYHRRALSQRIRDGSAGFARSDIAESRTQAPDGAAQDSHQVGFQIPLEILLVRNRLSHERITHHQGIE